MKHKRWWAAESNLTAPQLRKVIDIELIIEIRMRRLQALNLKSWSQKTTQKRVSACLWD